MFWRKKYDTVIQRNRPRLLKNGDQDLKIVRRNFRTTYLRMFFKKSEGYVIYLLRC